MLRKTFFLVSILFSNVMYAGEYSIQTNAGAIHTTMVKSSSFCANLAVSTKVGIKSGNGQCAYQKETTPDGFDSCVFYLNSYYLEQSIGLGFNCAATHVHSNLTDSDDIDEYQLISNGSGHYTGTNPSQGSVKIK
jgi:hypothetical protein